MPQAECIVRWVTPARPATAQPLPPVRPTVPDPRVARSPDRPPGTLPYLDKTNASIVCDRRKYAGIGAGRARATAHRAVRNRKAHPSDRRVQVAANAVNAQ